jgi:hypothetical protein
LEGATKVETNGTSSLAFIDEESTKYREPTIAKDPPKEQ